MMGIAADLARSANLDSRRLCPVCGRGSAAFAPFGDPPRPEAQCTGCSSLERHRLVWLYFVRRSAVFDGSNRRVLHVAPEECLERQFRTNLGDGYATADLTNPRVDVRTDIMNIGC